MNLEKFNAQKLEPEQMHPLVGGADGDGSNCGTIETNSKGADVDIDNDRYLRDKDDDLDIIVTPKPVDGIG